MTEDEDEGEFGTEEQREPVHESSSVLRVKTVLRTADFLVTATEEAF
jgi:hypothetical protein